MKLELTVKLQFDTACSYCSNFSFRKQPCPKAFPAAVIWFSLKSNISYPINIMLYLVRFGTSDHKENRPNVHQQSVQCGYRKSDHQSLCSQRSCPQLVSNNRGATPQPSFIYSLWAYRLYRLILLKAQVSNNTLEW